MGPLSAVTPRAEVKRPVVPPFNLIWIYFLEDCTESLPAPEAIPKIISLLQLLFGPVLNAFPAETQHDHRASDEHRLSRPESIRESSRVGPPINPSLGQREPVYTASGSLTPVPR